MLGFSPIGSNALGEIPSQQTSATLSAVLVSLSTIQSTLTVTGGSSIPLICGIASSGIITSNLSLAIKLSTSLQSLSTFSAYLAGTGGVGIGDRVEIRRLQNKLTITKV